MSKSVAGAFSMMSMTAALLAGQAPSAVRSDLAPTGKLRVGINYGNQVLATKDAATGELRGIAVDLAREVGRRLELPVELVGYSAAGRIADGVRGGEWDMAFLAADPARAADIAFTPPYLEIEATYLVPAGSSLRTLQDVDHEGIRIAAPAGSAYELFLSRSLKSAQLLRTDTTPAADAAVVSGRADALAGLRDRLLNLAEQLPGSRVLDGRFTVAQQAIGIPKGRDAATKYLTAFVEEIKTSGLVARAIESTGARGVSVAPLTRSQ